MIAALASYLDARSRGGEWRVRIEDVDTPRVVPGAADSILQTLDTFGLHWDGPILFQSDRGEHYTAALGNIVDAGLAYACSCSRRDLATSARLGPTGRVYPGTCRAGMRRARPAPAIRLRTDRVPVSFRDRLQGIVTQRLDLEVGDFVIRRADGLFAYHLAVVIDDAAQGVTDVVRGNDLLQSTPAQIYLQRVLRLPEPRYLHVPLVVDRAGQKLGKSTRAAAIDRQRPGPSLISALRCLNQPVPTQLTRADVASILSWATRHWEPLRIPTKAAICWR